MAIPRPPISSSGSANGALAAASNDALRRPLYAQATMARKATKATTVVMLPRMPIQLMSLMASSLRRAHREAEALQVRDRRVELGAVLELVRRLGDLLVGVRHADRAQRAHLRLDR